VSPQACRIAAELTNNPEIRAAYLDLANQLEILARQNEDLSGTQKAKVDRRAPAMWRPVPTFPAPASPNSVDLMAVSARLEVSPRAMPAQELPTLQQRRATEPWPRAVALDFTTRY
jgi:hypothetical protein